VLGRYAVDAALSRSGGRFLDGWLELLRYEALAVRPRLPHVEDAGDARVVIEAGRRRPRRTMPP